VTLTIIILLAAPFVALGALLALLVMVIGRGTGGSR
jgi:hypothetical protein